MPLWSVRLRLRLRSLLHAKELDDDLRAELAFHVAELKAEFTGEGLPEPEAEATARRAFGSPTSVAEQCRDERRMQWIEDLIQDVRFACRSFRKSPVFTAAAILTLALGVGANTAFLSTAYTILLRPLAFPNPDRLVSLEGGVMGIGPVTALRNLSRSVEYAGYLPDVELDVDAGGELRKALGAAATYNLLRVLGAAPALGRWFEAAEETPGRHRVALISEAMWRERFGADPAVVGRRILVSEEPFEIVGVMPPGFAVSSPPPDLWFPVRIDPRAAGDMWGGGNLRAIGRLHDGVTLRTAQAGLPSLVNRIRAMFPWRMPDEWGVDARIVRLDEALSGRVRTKLVALAVAATLLLLIACGNVANLLLARALGREREFAMREALGAGRMRLIRQMSTESLLLSLAAGAAAALTVAVILKSLPTLLPKETPRLTEVGVVDPALLVIGACTLAFTVAVSGLAPMMHVWRPRAEPLIGRATTPSRRTSRLSLTLIGGQLALAAALLIGAALMARTLRELDRVELGVHSTGLVSARVSAGPSRCPNAAACEAFLRAIGDEVTRLGGIQRVAWANLAPLDSQTISAVSVDLQDHERPPNAPAYVLWQTTSTPDYFRTLGIRLREGRLFTSADRENTPAVTVISESTARRFWPGESAVGKRIRSADRDWRTIVGVVSDVAQYALTGFPPWIDGVEYVPLAQSYVLRTSRGVQVRILVESVNPQDTAAALSRYVQQHFSAVVVSSVKTLNQMRNDSLADQRSTAILLALFSTLGLFLGVIGVHGVVAHRTGQRTREIGVRIALGASGPGVIRMILGETALVTAAGLSIGMAGAYMLSRFLRSMLFGVGPHDVLTFVLCPSILLCAALTAAALPAVQAAGTDPSVTLREE